MLALNSLPLDARRAQVLSTLQELADGSLPEAALLGLFDDARDGQPLIASLFWQVCPGKTAVVWMPRVHERQPKEAYAEAVRRLLEAVDHHVRDTGTHVVQISLEEAMPEQRAILGSLGYFHLADLVYIVATRDAFPDQEPTVALKFVPFGEDDKEDPATEARFAALVEATYIGTLDCPGLDESREVADVLDGYRQTGVYSPRRWFFVRERDRDIGCLILTDHPEHNQWELIYMGVVPEVRGRGFGVEIARYAQWAAGRAGRERVVLAVDGANEPARRMYATAGYHPWERRIVFIKNYRRATVGD